MGGFASVWCIFFLGDQRHCHQKLVTFCLQLLISTARRGKVYAITQTSGWRSTGSLVLFDYSELIFFLAKLLKRLRI
jgi:hypothetical protein